MGQEGRCISPRKGEETQRAIPLTDPLYAVGETLKVTQSLLVTAHHSCVFLRQLMTGCLCKEMASVPVYGFVSLNKAINALHQNVRECDIEPLLLPFELAQVTSIMTQ